MRQGMEQAIKCLTERALSAKSEDALRFTQAALNLAHVLATLDNMSK